MMLRFLVVLEDDFTADDGSSISPRHYYVYAFASIASTI
jgi:hypothetical protein